MKKRRLRTISNYGWHHFSLYNTLHEELYLNLNRCSGCQTVLCPATIEH